MNREKLMADKFRVIVLRDGDVFVAQCLEVDIAAQGTTADEALTRLGVAFRAELREAQATGRSIEDIGPAPEAMSLMYESDVVERTTLAAA
jgi:hypothetical protein